MIRFIIAAIWTGLFLIVSIPFLIIEFLFGLFFPVARAASSQAIISFAFRGLTLIAGTEIVVKGKENIPQDTPVLFTPNHRSIFDIIITYPLCPGRCAYIAKQETKKIPIFSLWMALMNCQFLDRHDLRKGLKMILKSVDLVNGGSSICIFPEGTRNKGSEPLLPFHDGSLKIAEKAECPVVPIAISNTEKIFEAQFPKIRKAKVIIEYCKPIETKGLSKEEKRAVSRRAQEEILEAYNNNLKEF